MKAALSDEQRHAIQQGAGLPLEIADQQTNETFFLISAEQYEKARPVLQGIEEIDPSFYEVDDIELTADHEPDPRPLPLLGRRVS
jgi:hypothetical protein